MDMGSQYKFRAMKKKDIPAVLDIIFATDDDDAEWAEETYQQGVAGHCVLCDKNTVIGVTGAQIAEGTDRCVWLSWTYLHPSAQGGGAGAYMLEELFASLQKSKVRKIFASASTYPVYEQAIRLYKRVGFSQEVLHKDFYAPGEDQIVFGKRLNHERQDKIIEPERGDISLLGFFPLDEAEDVVAVDWDFAEEGRFTKSELDEFIAKVRSRGFRLLFFSGPSNVEGIYGLIQSSGFSQDGMLKDYYEDGLHDQRYLLKL